MADLAFATNLHTAHPIHGSATSDLAHARKCIDRYDWSLLTAEALVLRAPASDGRSADAGRFIRTYLGEVRRALLDRRERQRRELAAGDLWRFVYCLAINRYPERADDVAQTALTIVMETLDACRCDETFFEFVLWKVRAAATDQLRFDRHRTTLMMVVSQSDLAQAGADASDDPWLLLPDDSPSVDEIVSQRECARHIVAAINRLPNARQREVLLLDLSEALPDEDIARRMGIAPGHVRKLRHDARAKLRADALLVASLRTAVQEVARA